MVNPGKINTLKVVKEVDFGLYLDGHNFGEVLMPKRYVSKDLKPGDDVEVFLYFDSEDRLVATTEIPLAQTEEFAYLKVKEVAKPGAFLDWGVMKDLLVPFREQRTEMQAGSKYLVYIYLDHVTQRIVASSRLERFLDNVPHDYESNQEVDLLIWEKTPLGYKAIINGLHTGLLYENEVFQVLNPGMKLKGYIKAVREDEKIDLALQKAGMEHVDATSAMILEKLKSRGGFIEANDNTSPESIKHMFGISKKVFKKAIGQLYKSRLITIEDKGIRLVK